MYKVAIKYCGGCNPEYDRVGLVGRIKQSLNGKVEFVSLKDENIDLLLAIEGCPTACADLSTIKTAQIRIISKVDNAIDFLKDFNASLVESTADLK